eukprot:GHVT01008956.1.p1 GENE.GHVT01008956.1~~GHVT01008956.1.p1  ORF type:complete len:493 (-),score=76.35 GHVT01008956.1:1008-2486(-)
MVEVSAHGVVTTPVKTADVLPVVEGGGNEKPTAESAQASAFRPEASPQPLLEFEAGEQATALCSSTPSVFSVKLARLPDALTVFQVRATLTAPTPSSPEAQAVVLQVPSHFEVSPVPSTLRVFKFSAASALPQTVRLQLQFDTLNRAPCMVDKVITFTADTSLTGRIELTAPIRKVAIGSLLLENPTSGDVTFSCTVEGLGETELAGSPSRSVSSSDDKFSASLPPPASVPSKYRDCKAQSLPSSPSWPLHLSTSSLSVPPRSSRALKLLWRPLLREEVHDLGLILRSNVLGTKRYHVALQTGHAVKQAAPDASKASMADPANTLMTRMPTAIEDANWNGQTPPPTDQVPSSKVRDLLDALPLEGTMRLENWPGGQATESRRTLRFTHYGTSPTTYTWQFAPVDGVGASAVGVSLIFAVADGEAQLPATAAGSLDGTTVGVNIRFEPAAIGRVQTILLFQSAELAYSYKVQTPHTAFPSRETDRPAKCLKMR